MEGGSNQESFSISGSDEFPVGLYRHLLISDHLDKFGEIDKSISITISLFDHFHNLILGESLPKVEHAGPKFIFADSSISVRIKGSL